MNTQKMKDAIMGSRKGISQNTVILISVFILAATIAVVGLAQVQGDAASADDGNDGYIDTIQTPQDAANSLNDLSITDQDGQLSENGTVFDTNVVSALNVTAASEATDIYYGMGFEVQDGSIEDLNVNVDMNNGSILSTRDAYLMEDIENNDISDAGDALEESVDLEVDDNEDIDESDVYDITGEGDHDGQYVFTTLVRTVNSGPEDLSDDSDLLTVTLDDGDTDEDNDDHGASLTYTIDNVQ